MKVQRVLEPAACVLVAALVLVACGKGSVTKTAARASASSTSTSPLSPVVGVETNPTLGQLLVDAQGMTLYHNAGERDGAFVCTGTCTSAWPPLLVPAGTAPTAGAGVPGALATVTRPDSGIQVTYNGEPLYRFVGDKKPGDANGQGVAGVWFVLSPSAAAATTQPPTTTTVPRAPAAAPTTRPAAPAAPKAPPATAPPATMAPTTTPPRTTPPTTSCAYPPCY
jgi:predicted lipoprotein with Yx(FWY)xxD motif